MPVTAVARLVKIVTSIAVFLIPHPGFYAVEPACKVVLHFRCKVRPIYGTKDLESLVKKTIREKRVEDQFNSATVSDEIRDIVMPSTIYIVDLNNDSSPEYIVPVDCGAVGNCHYVIFADHPARVIGELWAEYIIFTPQSGQWPDIITYCHETARDGAVARYVSDNGFYKVESDRCVREPLGQEGKPADTYNQFMKEMGGVRCTCDGGS